MTTTTHTSVPGIPGVLFINMGRGYLYRGVYFEWHSWCGPMLLRKDGEPSKRVPGARFYDITAEWHGLSETEREQYRVY